MGRPAETTISSAIEDGGTAPTRDWWFLGINLVVTVAAVLIIASLSAPGGYFFMLAVSVLVVFATGVMWFLVIAVRAARRRLTWHPKLAVVPAAVALIMALGILDLPLKTRFAFARPAFDEAVTGLSTNDCQWTNDEQMIGTYRIRSATRAGSVSLFSHGGFIFSESGFAHWPDGEPNSDFNRFSICGFEGVQLEKITGDWYRFHGTW